MFERAAGRDAARDGGGSCAAVSESAGYSLEVSGARADSARQPGRIAAGGFHCQETVRAFGPGPPQARTAKRGTGGLPGGASTLSGRPGAAVFGRDFPSRAKGVGTGDWVLAKVGGKKRRK